MLRALAWRDSSSSALSPQLKDQRGQVTRRLAPNPIPVAMTKAGADTLRTSRQPRENGRRNLTSRQRHANRMIGHWQSRRGVPAGRRRRSGVTVLSETYDYRRQTDRRPAAVRLDLREHLPERWLLLCASIENGVPCRGLSQPVPAHARDTVSLPARPGARPASAELTDRKLASPRQLLPGEDQRELGTDLGGFHFQRTSLCRTTRRRSWSASTAAPVAAR